MQTVDTAGMGCWRCRAGTAGALVCPSCQAVQPLAPGADHFALLGLPRRLAIDAADLEHRYHTASRQVHPDRHQTAGARERELSLAASAAVNRAYRTLLDPVARGRYWLELHDRHFGGGPEVPAGIAAEVFETQERLEALRRAGSGPEAAALREEVRALHDALAGRVGALRDALVACYAAWKDGAELAELERRLVEIAYLRTLLGDLEGAVGEGPRGTDHRH